MMKLIVLFALCFIASAYAEEHYGFGKLHGSYVVPENGVNNQINLGYSGEVAVYINGREMQWYFHHSGDTSAGSFTGVTFWEGKPGVRGSLLWDPSDFTVTEEDEEEPVLSGEGESPHLGWFEFPEVEDEDEEDEEEAEDVFEDLMEAFEEGNLYIQITTSQYSDGLLRAQILPYDELSNHFTASNIPTYVNEIPMGANNEGKFLASIKSKAKLHGDFVLPHGVTTEASGSVKAKYTFSNNMIEISYGTNHDNDEQRWSNVLFLVGGDDSQDTSNSKVLWNFSLLPDEDVDEDDDELQSRKIKFPATQYAFRQIFEQQNTYLLVEDALPHLRGNLENSNAATIVISMAIIVLVAIINILF